MQSLTLVNSAICKQFPQKIRFIPFMLRNIAHRIRNTTNGNDNDDDDNNNIKRPSCPTHFSNSSIRPEDTLYVEMQSFGEIGAHSAQQRGSDIRSIDLPVNSHRLRTTVPRRVAASSGLQVVVNTCCGSFDTATAIGPPEFLAHNPSSTSSFTGLFLW
ncbi:hypothetical protein BC835DRAFT_1357214 [Cytidiella melzeri]|nr:hypothetical protein BC835DRAFT_1357214 [Cytidiella melzeri]